MKLLTCLSSLTLLTLTTFNGVQSLPNNQHFVSDLSSVIDNRIPVKGDSPIEFCDADQSEDKVRINSVDISPNPPLPGKSLIIHATGEVLGEIRNGAYAKVIVKYGLIQLLSTTIDLCSKLLEVGLSCPLESGAVNITKEVKLPLSIPPGTYNLFADAYDEDDERLTCLKASVTFAR